MSALVYLYAVARADAAAWLERNQLRGIGDARVRGVAEGALSGAASEVPAEDFEQEPLDRNVADPAWLEPRAAAHQTVNAALLEGLGAVLPLAFGTIYRAEDGVRRLLRERAADLEAALARAAGHVEWVVSLQRDPDAAAAYLAAGEI
ncbi:MAG: GvpL/GvpF family gas vesicle protein, partial [Candidatus Limnocylindria bacterium]